MRKINLLFLLVLIFSAGLHAATIVVDLGGGGQYTSIHAAADAAADGDTLLVMSGTYVISVDDGIITVDKELHILGSGFDLPADGGTTLQSSTGLFVFNGNADGSTLSGFRMYGYGTLINVSVDDMVIEKNHIIGSPYSNNIYCVYFNTTVTGDTLRDNIIGYTTATNYHYLVGFANTTDVTVNNNIFFNSTQSGITPTTGTNNKIMNNLFLSCYNSITTDGPVSILNNIFMNGIHTQIVNSGGSPTISNNCFFNNTTDGDTGIDPVLENPDFVDFGNNDVFGYLSIDEGGFDFHLQTVSPCIDAGNALFDYFDLDGTRNDVGAYGGPYPIGTTGAPTIPVVNSISVTPSTVSPSGTITINATGRIGE